MDNPSAGEAKLLAKYWNTPGFESDDQFWADVLEYLKDTNVLLPVENSPENVRMVRGWLDCKAGECGECCRYGITPIVQPDVKRIVDSGTMTVDQLQEVVRTRADGSMYMRGEPAGTDCPLLKDNVCTVYSCRPNACYFFPVQGGVQTKTTDGKPIVQMRYRVKCKESVSVIRKVLTEVIRKGDKMMLPNLVVIPKGGN